MILEICVHKLLDYYFLPRSMAILLLVLFHGARGSLRATQFGKASSVRSYS